MAEVLSEHRIALNWQREGVFSHEGFERRHEIRYQDQLAVPAGGANNDYGTDPEQLLAAAMSSCHMLTFLSLAAKKRLQVVSYTDEAIAELERREDGKFRVAKIRLYPKVVFEGDNVPDADAVDKMHHKAHEHCFIANSVSCDVEVTPQF